MATNRLMLVKRAIIDALDALLENQEFERISVQDICERAQVSRTTFYRHFEDKYHLVNWTYANYKEVLNVKAPEDETYQLSLSYLLAFMQDRQSFFKNVLKYTGQNSLADFMLDVTNSYFLLCAHPGVQPESLDIKERRMILFNAAGATEIIRQWVLNGCCDDPTDVVDDISANIEDDLGKILGICPDWQEQAKALGRMPGNPWK